MSRSSTSVIVEARAALVSHRLDLVRDARIVIAGGVITSVGPRREVDRPSGAVIVDATDALVVPGFIDSHVHIGLADPADVVAGGVTTVRDLGWPAGDIRRMARESARPGFDGPLVVFAGQMLTSDGGYPTRARWAPEGTGRAVGDPSDAKSAVADQVHLGAAVIKIALNPIAGPVLDTPTLTAVVECAHGNGLAVTAHVYGLDQLRRALDAGVDELAHMLMSPEVVPDDVITRMVGAGTVVVPTLSIRVDDHEVAIDNTRRFLAAGGTVIYGTDLGNEGPAPGIDRREIEAMATAGMSARRIIRSATVDAARRLDLATKGVIAPGMDADMVAVPAAALDDPAALTDVEMVWRDGRRVR